ncbi:uncharacterized protein [Montipora capricornis]|uniref:uncharacterized protein n=1 Tax=Montipora foliosa TaxID=591990 RepID=UPI0035F1B333
MYLKISFLLTGVIAVCWCAVNVEFSALPCNKQPAPRNGYLQCIKKPPSQDIICWMECKSGYDVTFLPAEYYVCNDNGTWVTPSGGPKFTKWPDCVVYKSNMPVP